MLGQAQLSSYATIDANAWYGTSIGHNTGTAAAFGLAETSCPHCGSIVLDARAAPFCCAGCQGAHDLLRLRVERRPSAPGQPVLSPAQSRFRLSWWPPATTERTGIWTATIPASTPSALLRNAPDVISVGTAANFAPRRPAQRERHRRGRTLQPQEHRCAGGRLIFLPVHSGRRYRPLVDVSKIGDPTACTALPAGSLNNSFALIAYSTCGSSSGGWDSEALNAQNAGAVGFVYIMPAGTAVAPSTIFLPRPAFANTALRFRSPMATV